MTEFFVLLLAPVQEFSPGPALAGSCEGTRCAASPLHPRFGSQSDNRKSPLRPSGRERRMREGGKKKNKHKGNQQIPPFFLLELRET